MATRKRNKALTGTGVDELKGFVIKKEIFDEDKMKLIEALPSGDETIVIFFKLLALACKSNAGGFIVMDRRVPFTEEALSGIWGRSLQKVRFALNTLIDFGMIEYSEEDGFCVADFEKWMTEDEKYKLKTRERVARHREKQKQLPTPKEKKFADDSVEVRLSELLFAKMRENNPEAKAPNIQSWANHIRLMIERDNRTPEQIKNMIEWCQADSFWKTNILSTKKLRDKYDQLKVRALEDYNRQRTNGMSRREQNVDEIFDRLLTGGENDHDDPRRLNRP